MIIIVLLLGALIALFGLFGLLHPDGLMRLVKKTMSGSQGIYLAIGGRILIGLVLIFSAWEARYPLAFKIIGIASLVTAATAAIMGANRLQIMVDWWLGKSTGFVRLWSMIAVAFGLFMVFNIL